MGCGLCIPKPCFHPPSAAPDSSRVRLWLHPWREAPWAGRSCCHQSRGLIHKSSAGQDRAWGGAGDGVGNRSCFVAMEPAWRACVCGGSGGRGSAALWLKALCWLLLAQLMAGLGPAAAPSSTQSPCSGASPPQQPLSPVIPQSRPGRRAQSREWSQENPLTPAHRTNPRRPQALLATCLLGEPPLGLSFPICTMEGGNAGLLEVL